MSDEKATEEKEVNNEEQIPSTISRGQNVLHPNRENMIEVIQNLRDEGFIVCIDVTAVDYLENPKRDLPISIKPCL